MAISVVLRDGPLDGRRAILAAFEPPPFLVTRGLEIRPPEDIDKPKRWQYFLARDPVGLVLVERESYDFVYEYYER